MRIVLAVLIFLANPVLAQTPQSGDCRDLRRACEMKDELGEGNENCVRYQRDCSPNTPHVNCVWIRTGCLWAEELGLNHRTVCQSYRENCKQ